MKSEILAYYKALGAHLALMRKSRGLTQSELARKLGVSQQAVFAYELGERRPSVFLMSKMAQVFAVAMDDLTNANKPPRIPKRQRLSPRCVRHAERLQALPKTQQRFVARIIDSLESSNAR